MKHLLSHHVGRQSDEKAEGDEGQKQGRRRMIVSGKKAKHENKGKKKASPFNCKHSVKGSTLAWSHRKSNYREREREGESGEREGGSLSKKRRKKKGDLLGELRESKQARLKK